MHRTAYLVLLVSLAACPTIIVGDASSPGDGSTGAPDAATIDTSGAADRLAAPDRTTAPDIHTAPDHATTTPDATGHDMVGHDASMPQPGDPAVQRGADYMGTPERFNRYYTDPDWTPSQTVYVTHDGSGDGTTPTTPASVAGGLNQAAPGVQITFLRGAYSGCYELSDREGSYDQPIVLYAERNLDGSRGVHIDCCGTGRQTCFNLEGADYIAIDGFEAQGGSYGVRAVGLGYTASQHQRGVAVIDCAGWSQSKDPFFSGQSDWAVFEGNYAHHAGSGDGHGIYLSNGSDWNIVRFNHLHSNANAGFQINADPLSTCGDFFSAECAGLASDGLGAGASDFMLVDSNYFHHSDTGPNFTSVRHSVVRNNIFALFERHTASFWQETDNPALGSSDNIVHHNLFTSLNHSHMLQFIRHSTRNDVKNNLFVGVEINGAVVTASSDALWMEVDGTVDANQYAGNYYIAGSFDGRSANGQETTRPDFNVNWFQRFPTGLPSTADDFRPTAISPFLDLGTLLAATPVDREGTPRSTPVDIGPYERP